MPTRRSSTRSNEPTDSLERDDELPTGGGFIGTRRAPAAERVDWDSWYRWFASEWAQGEHLSVIGPTGTGKTTLELELLKIRRYVVFIATKPADDKIASLERNGYTRLAAWPRYGPPDNVDRVLLWPKGAGSMGGEGKARQRAVIHDALRKIFEGPKGGKPGRWCVCIDEARYVADPKYLGLGSDINQLLIQGRSIYVSMVLGFQRPSWVPQEAYDQPSHLFIAGDNDRRNVARFREIGGVDGAKVASTVRTLRQYEWAHIDARPGKGDIQVIKVPPNLAGRGGARKVTARDLQPTK